MINRICLHRALYVTRLRGGHLPFVEALSSPLTGRHTPLRMYTLAPPSTTRSSHTASTRILTRAQHISLLATTASLLLSPHIHSHTYTHMPYCVEITPSADRRRPHRPPYHRRCQTQSAVPSLGRTSAVLHSRGSSASTTLAPTCGRCRRCDPPDRKRRRRRMSPACRRTTKATRRLLPSPRSSLSAASGYVKPRSASESSSVTMQISFITQSGSSANLRAHPTSPPFCSSPALSEGPIFAFFCIPFCGFNMARPGRESRDYSTPGRSLHGQRW